MRIGGEGGSDGWIRIPVDPRVAPLEQGPVAPSLEPTQKADEAGSFGSVLTEMVQGASAQSTMAAEKARALADGATDDLHGTMIALKKADISMKLVGQIRNKLLDAFHEIWRTGV